jgi:hypothetical protein
VLDSPCQSRPWLKEQQRQFCGERVVSSLFSVTTEVQNQGFSGTSVQTKCERYFPLTKCGGREDTFFRQMEI